MNEIDQAIAENALRPKRVQGDSGSVESQSIQDQIAASKHLAGRTAASKPARGLRFTKLIMPETSS